MATEKEKCIKGYYDNLKKMQEYFDVDIELLTKTQKKFLRYKFACVDAHPDCDKIPKNKVLFDFEACQVKCKYSYDYVNS